MYRQFLTNEPQGFPIELDKFLKWQQEAYSNAIDGLAALCGNMTIISGMNVSAGIVSDGWIFLNNEMIFFKGGAIDTTFYVETITENLVYQGGINKPVLITKQARFGTSAVQYNYADLQVARPWLKYDVKEVDCDATYLLANFDLGTGLGKGERVGWAICDGRNGTRNRGGRVSVGFEVITIDPSDNVWDAVYNTIGAIGGEKKHTLTAQEFNHRHSGDMGEGTGPASVPDNTTPNPLNQRDRKFYTDYLIGGVNGTDGGANPNPSPHENRQPFIVTLFIQKL